MAPAVMGHLAASLKQQWKRYRKELKRCQKKFSEKAVHETRIATRRLLSLVELLGPFLSATNAEAVRERLKRHLDTFDDLRDTHVQLLAVASLRRPFPAARPFHAYLRDREDRLTRRARKDIRRIKLRRLGTLVAACRDDFDAWRRESDPETALARLFRSVNDAFARTQALRARINPGDPLTIHRTRIAFKKYRYMVEALVPSLPGLSPSLLARMRRYQARMGSIQDAEVLLAGLDKFLRKTKTARAEVAPFRAAIVRRQQRWIRTFMASSGKLDEFRGIL